MQNPNLKTTATVGTFVLIGWLAFANHLVQDDGFISLTYARNWAHGHGPVWYPGSREFGYTNFLYVALVAALSAIGVGTLNAAAIVGYTAFAGSVAVAFKLTKVLTKSDVAALCSILLIFTNYVVSTFAHGMLECSLQVFWVLSTYYLTFQYIEKQSTLTAAAISLAASFSLLTRLDSALLVLPAAVFLLVKIRPHQHLAIFITIPFLIVGGYLYWCHHLYGTILPTTFYIKAHEPRISYGFWYFHNFLGNEIYIYPISALLALFVLFHRTSGRIHNIIKNGKLLSLIFACIIWIIYVLYIGGDFISFRILIPFITIYYLVICTILSQNDAYQILSGLVVYSMVASGAHWFIDQQNSQFYSRGHGIDSPRALRNYVTRPEIGWLHTGAVLGELFYTGSKSDPMIAVIAAGAIPFQSRLHSIDMHGLNDIWTAKHGEKFSNRPGHLRIATREYLDHRQVNLIIGPHHSCGSALFPVRESLTERYGDLPIILVPVSANCRMTALYLREHPKIEEQLSKGTIFKQDVAAPPPGRKRSEIRPRLILTLRRAAMRMGVYKVLK